MQLTSLSSRLACIYVAGKVEESLIPVANIADPLKVDPKSILAKEIVLFEGLNFQLIVYHPYRALHGFIMDIKVCVVINFRDD